MSAVSIGNFSIGLNAYSIKAFPSYPDTVQEFYEYNGQDPELSGSLDEYLVGNWVYEPRQGFNQDDNFGIRFGDHAFLDTDYDPVLEEIELFPL